MTAMMIEAALRALLLAIAVGAGLRVLRVTNVPVRKAAWSLVLIAALAMPFLMRWTAVTSLADRIGWMVPIHRVVPQARSSATEPESKLTVATLPMTHRAEASRRGPLHAAVRRKKATPVEAAPARPTVRHAEASAADAGMSAPRANAVPVSTRSASPRHAWNWPAIERLVVMIYLIVSGALLLRLLWGLGAALWLWSRAEEIPPLDVPEENVRVSAKIPSPVTIGSGIVLPATYRQWDRAKLRVVLAHERSHVRQMDFYLQFLAGFYAAAFWFSPLGWWLKRALSALGEAISDRAGLEAAPSRSDYAGVLLEFAAGTQRALPGVAMARRGNLSRRVDQMLNDTLFRKAFSEGRRRAIVSLLLVPAALFAATALVKVPRVTAQTEPKPQSATPANASTPAQEQSATQQPVTGQSNPPETRIEATLPATAQNPAVPQAPEAPPAAAEPLVPQSAAPAPAPAAAPQAVPAPPLHPLTPEAAIAPEPPSDDDMPMVLDVDPMPKIAGLPDTKLKIEKLPKVLLDGEEPQLMALGNLDSNFSWPGDGMFLVPNGSAHGYAYYFSSNGDSWALVDGAGKNFSLGSGSDKQQLDLAQRMAKGPFLWFSHEGKSYIVDDPAVVSRIQSVYAPMRDLAHQQEAWAVQQRVMARMEAERARQQRTEASIRVPDLSKEMADAEAALNNLKSQQGQMLSEEKLAEMQAKLAEVEARLGALQSRSLMQDDFAEKMRARAEQEREMVEREKEVRAQEKTQADQAQKQVQSIIEECLHNGKATPVK